MSMRIALTEQAVREVGASLCISVAALILFTPAHAQTYCAKPLSAKEFSALMDEMPIRSAPRPAVVAIHRSATKPSASPIQLFAVFPRFVGGDPWPEMPIKYVVDSSASDRTKILDTAIAEWEAKTLVRFRKIDEKEAKASPHYFVVRGDDAGCYTNDVGYLKGGAALINFDRTCDVHAAIHEIGHRLGLEHEHERPDRDQYIAIDWEKVEKRLKAIEEMDAEERKSLLRNLGKLADIWEKGKNWVFKNQVSEYDLISIMHYGSDLEVVGKFFEITTAGRRSLSNRFGAGAAEALNDIGAGLCITQWDADAINARYKGTR